MPFNLALEANNLGRILDLWLALLLFDHGLLIVELNPSPPLSLGGFFPT